MATINTINQLMDIHSITAYRLSKDTGLHMDTAYSLYKDRGYIPREKVIDAIWKAYKWQPGMYIMCVSDKIAEQISAD